MILNLLASLTDDTDFVYIVFESVLKILLGVVQIKAGSEFKLYSRESWLDY